MKSNIGFIYAIAAAVVWGLAYAIDEKILHSVSPLTLLFINSLLATLVLLPFILMDNGPIKKVITSGRNGLLIILAAFVLLTLGNFLIYSGINNLGASTASIIEISYPVFVVAFSFLLFRNVPNIYFLLGAVLIFIGSFTIIKFG